MAQQVGGANANMRLPNLPSTGQHPTHFVPSYQGYLLQKGKKLSGEKPSWSTPTVDPYSVTQKEFDAEKRRMKSPHQPLVSLSALRSDSQKDAISRILKEQRLGETNPYATWDYAIIHPTRGSVKGTFGNATETTSITVILKRQPRSDPLVNSSSLTKFGGLVDTSQPQMMPLQNQSMFNNPTTQNMNNSLPPPPFIDRLPPPPNRMPPPPNTSRPPQNNNASKGNGPMIPPKMGGLPNMQPPGANKGMHPARQSMEFGEKVGKWKVDPESDSFSDSDSDNDFVNLGNSKPKMNAKPTQLPPPPPMPKQAAKPMNLPPPPPMAMPPPFASGALPKGMGPKSPHLPSRKVSKTDIKMDHRGEPKKIEKKVTKHYSSHRDDSSDDASWDRMSRSSTGSRRSYETGDTDYGSHYTKDRYRKDSPRRFRSDRSPPRRYSSRERRDRERSRERRDRDYQRRNRSRDRSLERSRDRSRFQTADRKRERSRDRARERSLERHRSSKYPEYREHQQPPPYRGFSTSPVSSSSSRSSNSDRSPRQAGVHVHLHTDGKELKRIPHAPVPGDPALASFYSNQYPPPPQRTLPYPEDEIFGMSSLHQNIPPIAPVVPDYARTLQKQRAAEEYMRSQSRREAIAEEQIRAAYQQGSMDTARRHAEAWQEPSYDGTSRRLEQLRAEKALLQDRVRTNKGYESLLRDRDYERAPLGGYDTLRRDVYPPVASTAYPPRRTTSMRGEGFAARYPREYPL